ncbi:MAG: hypothetical protein ACLR23_09480 [Clostridia bacterium]
MRRWKHTLWAVTLSHFAEMVAASEETRLDEYPGHGTGAGYRGRFPDADHVTKSQQTAEKFLRSFFTPAIKVVSAVCVPRTFLAIPGRLGFHFDR